MAIKRKLPVLNPEVPARVASRVPAAKPRAPASAAKPTVERARARLGGPIGDTPPLKGFPGGTVVEITTEADRPLAVVLLASVDEVSLLIDAERVRRVPPTAIAATSRLPSGLLADLAVDARIFGWLVEGQEVCFTRSATSVRAVEVERGKLIAKCRYGGLVAKPDGKILAVGFRNLCPATTAGVV